MGGLHAPFFLMWLHTSFMVGMAPLASTRARCWFGPASALASPAAASRFRWLLVLFWPLWVGANYAVLFPRTPGWV